MEMTSASSSPSSPTPGEPANSASAKPTALPKDRPCPFCGQAFTSSSLGRHLDLYIKDKNPKPPDGVHDVDAIRGMRGKITRRQPKGSGPASTISAGHKRKASAELEGAPSVTQLNGNLGSQDAGSTQRPHPHGQSHATLNQAATGSSLPTWDNRPGWVLGAVGIGDVDQSPAQQEQPSVNEPVSIPSSELINHNISVPRLNWQATGVINDLPSTMRSPSNSGSSQQPPRHSIAAMPSTAERSAHEADSSLATTALKDILASIQRAHCRIQRPSAFPNFDPLSLNYPALILRLLGPPPTLFSSTPIPTKPSSATDYWPLSQPPDASFKSRLQQTLRARLKMHTSLCPPSELRFARNRTEVETGIAAEADKRYATLSEHVDAALEQWEAFPQEEREELWRLELLRLCAGQGEEIGDLEVKLEKTRDVVEELRAELARLRESNAQLISRGVWGAEGGASRANRAPVVTGALARDLLDTDDVGGLGPGGGWLDGAGLQKWDLDSVLARYDKIINYGEGLRPLWPGNAWRLDQLLKEDRRRDEEAPEQNESETRPGGDTRDQDLLNGVDLADPSLAAAIGDKRAGIHPLPGDPGYG